MTAQRPGPEEPRSWPPRGPSIAAFVRHHGAAVAGLDALFADRRLVDLLIGQGLVAPNRSELVQPERWEQLLAAVAGAARSNDVAGEPAATPVERLRRALGIAEDDLEGIPFDAQHSSLVARPIAGQNRIGYMPMGNVDFRHGLMLGGLGTGGIERGLDGSFRRFGITCTSSNVEDGEGFAAATQFHAYLASANGRFASALAERPSTGLVPAAFRWALAPEQGSHHALYPMEWWVYRVRAVPAEIRVQALSPVLPHNYRESSYPLVVYRVTIRNLGAGPLDAAFLFSVQNIVGWLPQQRLAPEAIQHERVDRQRLNGVRPIFEPSPAWDRRSGFAPDSRGHENRIIDDASRITLVLGRRAPRAGSPREPLGSRGSEVDGAEAHGQIALSIPRVRGLTISGVAEIDALGDADALASFYEKGELLDRRERLAEGTHRAGALAVRAMGLAPGEALEFPMALAYDFPHSRQGGRLLHKRYTAFFGSDGEQASALAQVGLAEHPRWQRLIHDFHRSIGERSELPSFARGAAINKLNLLQSTCLGWFCDEHSRHGLAILAEANKDDYECAETLDVSSYGMARLLFWPELEQASLSRFARAVGEEDATPTAFHCSDERPAAFAAALRACEQKIEAASSEAERRQRSDELAWFRASIHGPRKELDAVPHDLWSSRVGPILNAYTYQNANRWPDLPARAMLMALRNWRLDPPPGRLEHAPSDEPHPFSEQYAAFSRSMRWALDRFDRDGDGLPDFLIGRLPRDPDVKISLWTFDNIEWTLDDGINGSSAGVWVVAARAAERGAADLGLDGERAFWAEQSRRAATSYDERLWCPRQRRYRLGAERREVFADTFHFFYDALLQLDAFDRDRVRSTLRAIVDDNVRRFGDGYCGAVNATLDGEPCPGEQTIEMWTGVSHLLGLTLLLYRMPEGWDVLFGTETLATHRAGHFGDWAEAYTLEPGIVGVPAYGMRAKNYLRCLSLVNLLALPREAIESEGLPAARL